MPLLKRKPVIYAPLPSLTSILQPIVPSSAPSASTVPADEISTSQVPPAPELHLPPDSEDPSEQLELLLSALRGDLLPGAVLAVPGRRSVKANGQSHAGQTGVAPSPHSEGGNGVVAPLPGTGYKVKNVEVYYIEETGEIFLDYE
jgi:bromodomain adjacent to zinc finger domain protein 1A